MLSLISSRSLRVLSEIALLAFTASLVAPLPAQTFDASALRQPADLGAVWLVQTNDDPSYARADLDDSQWMRVDPKRSLKEYFPSTHPNVIWYRLHVKVAPNQTGLALEEFNLASAFEIYVNGEKLLETGSISPFRPYTFASRIVKRIPNAAITSGSVVIAMRLHISDSEWVSSFPGFFPYNLVIGDETALSDHVWLKTIGDNLLNWFYQFAGLGLGIIALALFTAQRRQREYLWIFLLFLVTALHAPLQFYLLFHNLPAWVAYVNGAFDFAGLFFIVAIFLAFLRVPLKGWMQGLLVLAAVGVFWNAAQTANGSGSALGVLLGTVAQLSLIAGVLPILLIVHWRRGNHEAGILLVPAIVASLATYLQLGTFIVGTIPGLGPAAYHFQLVVFNWAVGPFTINIGPVDGCLFALSLAVILVRRSARIAQQQALLETELAAAREVQQIILPEKIENIPGFAIESAYEPAQQVGGDFFQILSAPEGSLLLVIGDVAGKGLPAAMLVSVLVGAIRGVAEYTSEPAELLANLNQRLIGRVAGSLSTPMVAQIFAMARWRWQTQDICRPISMAMRSICRGRCLLAQRPACGMKRCTCSCRAAAG